MDPTDELCAVLADETRACDALGAVLADEQRALVALRPEAVLACVEQRVGVTRELTRLAARRRALTDLVPRLPPAPRARLDAALRSLRRALLAARALERRNAQLAVSGLGAVEEMLRALHAVAPGTRYGADARLDPPAGPDRIDRRA